MVRAFSGVYGFLFCSVAGIVVVVVAVAAMLMVVLIVLAFTVAGLKSSFLF